MTLHFVDEEIFDFSQLTHCQLETDGGIWVVDRTGNYTLSQQPGDIFRIVSTSGGGGFYHTFLVDDYFRFKMSHVISGQVMVSLVDGVPGTGEILHQEHIYSGDTEYISPIFLCESGSVSVFISITSTVSIDISDIIIDSVDGNQNIHLFSFPFDTSFQYRVDGGEWQDYLGDYTIRDISPTSIVEYRLTSEMNGIDLFSEPIEIFPLGG